MSTKKLRIPILSVVVGLIALAMATMAFAAEPTAILTYSNTAAVDGSYVEFTLAVSNAGDADSNSQTVQDTLPAGADWAIVEDSIGCELVPSASAGRLKLSCDKFIVPARDLEGVDTDGLRFVTIGGIVDECGSYLNTAQFNFAILRSTSVSVACPATPTPVPTVATTPAPTVTTGPVELPTATPTKSAAAVPSNIPKPPNTGTGPVDVADSPRNQLTAFVVFLLSLGAGVALFAIPLSYTKVRKVRR